jgi:hypothetical protein
MYSAFDRTLPAPVEVRIAEQRVGKIFRNAERNKPKP